MASTPSSSSSPSAGVDWRAFIPGLAAGLFLGLVVGVLAPTILNSPQVVPADAGNYQPPRGLAPEEPTPEEPTTQDTGVSPGSSTNTNTPQG